MDVLEQVRIIIYRFQEKGLEIFLVNHNPDSADTDVWMLPGGSPERKFQTVALSANDKVIELDPCMDRNGNLIPTYAIEGDWHDIPSIRCLIKYDLKLIKSKIRESFPGFDQGSYFGIMEAFRKVLPHEYAALKELKEILWDRNVLRNI